MPSSTLDILTRAIGPNLFPRGGKAARVLPTDQWSEACIELPADSPSPGPLRWDRSPFARGIFEAYDDPACGQITIMFPAQVAKTLIMHTMIAKAIATEPWPVMMALPSRDSYKNLYELKLRPLLARTRMEPGSARRLMDPDMLTAERASSQTGQTRWRHGQVLLMPGAGSLTAVSSHTAGRVFIDELGKMLLEMHAAQQTEAGALEQLRRRGTAFSDRFKIVLASTPNIAHQNIDAEYRWGSRETWWMPCPDCGFFQDWRFASATQARARDGMGGDGGGGGVRFEAPDWMGGGPLASDRLEAMPVEALARVAAHARATARYQCGHCQALHDDNARRAAIGLGRWVTPDAVVRPPHKHETPDSTGRNGQAWKLLCAAPDPYHRSFNVSPLCSRYTQIGDLAYRFVKNRLRPTQEFVNLDLGEPWRDAAQATEIAELIRAVETQPLRVCPRYPAGSLPDYTAWPGKPADAVAAVRPAVLVTGIDVQADRAYFVTVALSGAPRDWCWLVDWGQVLVDLRDQVRGGDNSAAEPPVEEPEPRADDNRAGDRWGALRRLARRSYAVGDQPGTKMAAHIAIDSGFATLEVYRFARSMGGHPDPGSREAKDGQLGWVVPMKGAAIRDPLELKKPGEADRMGEARMVRLLEFRDAVWQEEVERRLQTRAPAPGCLLFPEALDPAGELISHLTGEYCRTGRDHAGHEVRTWVRREGHPRHDYRDALKMALALAAQLGYGELTPDRIRAAPPAGAAVEPGSEGYDRAIRRGPSLQLPRL